MTGSNAALGLEIWMTGTKDELTAARNAIRAVATITQLGELHPLSGGDAGRYRAYLRVRVLARPATHRRTEPRGDGPHLTLVS